MANRNPGGETPDSTRYWNCELLMNDGHTVNFPGVTEIKTFTANEQTSHNLLPQGDERGNWLYLNPKAIVGLHVWEGEANLGGTEGLTERELIGAGASNATARGPDWPATTPTRPDTS